MIPLELADIQGNIHRAFGRYGFPFCRHLFFNIAEPAAGRRFVDAIRQRVTTAEPWGRDEGGDGSVRRPEIALNLGFTFFGLLALDLPTRTLRLLPDEFIDGMRCRAGILGDAGASDPENWDPAWRYGPHERDRQVHVWVSLNAGTGPDGRPHDRLAEWTAWLEGLVACSHGLVSLVTGHGKAGAGRWQDAEAIMKPGAGGGLAPVPQEHFGFTDGISDPVFDGQFDAAEVQLDAVGGGKIGSGRFDAARSWKALQAGEFILGQVDEAQEFPVATQPANFVRNGTFMVWRKLYQDVSAFDTEMGRQARIWQQATGATEEEAAETVRAKVVGRWRSGIPLAVAPTWTDQRRVAAQWEDCLDPVRFLQATPARRAEYQRMQTSFRYGDDLDGGKCPFGAHIRRANPRDMLDPLLSPREGASTLVNRRRILRRGLPFQDPDGRKGVVFMAMCASIFRQFEFIQQQWMNYGLDFDAGNDGCPLIGNRASPTKHVVPRSAANETPVLLADLPTFVTTCGGDYFFLPGLDALRMIAMGTVDPT